MTSIAITSIITATPMLMTTSKPQAGPRRSKAGRAVAAGRSCGAADRRPGSDERKRGGGAVPADDLAVAVLSGRRVLLFQAASSGRWKPAISATPRSLREWLAAVLADGSGFCDGVLLAHAHRAAASRDDMALRDVAELAAAFVPSRERQLETSAQGRAFVDIARGGVELSRDWTNWISYCDGAIVYPVAVGMVSAAHAIPLAATMHAFVHALTSNWISAGARLIPWGRPIASAFSLRWSLSWSQRQNGRWMRRSTTSAARPFAPISPACGTRRNTRGYSGHEGVEALGQRVAFAWPGFVTLGAAPAWADGTIGLDEVLTGVAKRRSWWPKSARARQQQSQGRARDLHRRASWQSLEISRRRPCRALSMQDRTALPQNRRRPGLFRRSWKSAGRSRQ